MLEPQSWCTGVLWVKIMSSFWTDDGGAFGIVPFLEASSLENQLIVLRYSWSFGQGWLQPAVASPPHCKLDGCC